MCRSPSYGGFALMNPVYAAKMYFFSQHNVINDHNAFND